MNLYKETADTKAWWMFSYILYKMLFTYVETSESFIYFFDYFLKMTKILEKKIKIIFDNQVIIKLLYIKNLYDSK